MSLYTTNIECSCGWRLRVEGAPNAPGYFLQRPRCDRTGTRSSRCGRSWIIVWYVAVEPAPHARVVHVRPESGLHGMDLHRALLTARAVINAARTEGEREMTGDDIRFMVAMLELMAAADPPVARAQEAPALAAVSAAGGRRRMVRR